MAVDRSWHDSARAHRTLRRGMRGEDARRWEVGLNARLDHIAGGAKLKVAVNGVVDDADLKAWRAVRGPLGLPPGHPPTARAQLYARRPRRRDPVTRARARRFRVGTARPRIITARQLGLAFQWVFGSKGTPYRCAGHYTAGHRAADAVALAAEARADHAFHRGKGWGGLSYDYMVADDGTLLLGNPIGRKSAHVGGNNSGNVGICCPGTTGDRPTSAQAATVRWLLANAHTSALPAEHRSPVDLRRLPLLGHNEYPGNATSCPGLFIDMYHAKGAQT